jgi:thaumarchaeosortase
MLKLLPFMAFLVPLLWLYMMDSISFELMWKGRAFQLFFIWLIVLELILDWKKIKTQHNPKSVSHRTVALIITLFFPTVYVVATYFLGLGTAIAETARQNGVEFYYSMPLATEYLVFTAFFCLTTFLAFGKEGLARFAIPTFLLGVVGTIYTIDNVYPYGQFTPFQLLVPTTAWLAANVLTLMGYHTVYTIRTFPFSGTMPYVTTTNPADPTKIATFAVAWPCAGIESLLIFTVVTLLFLKRTTISWKASAGYFAVGAIVTYLINILRVVTIFTIGINYGVGSDAVNLFHFYSGPLISISWIVAYPLLILAIQTLQHRCMIRKTQPIRPNLA